MKSHSEGEILVFHNCYTRIYVQLSNHTLHMRRDSRHMVFKTSCTTEYGDSPVGEKPVSQEAALHPPMWTPLPLELMGYAAIWIYSSAKLPAVDRRAMSHSGGRAPLCHERLIGAEHSFAEYLSELDGRPRALIRDREPDAGTLNRISTTTGKLEHTSHLTRSSGTNLCLSFG
jgi:hypothetical protein